MPIALRTIETASYATVNELKQIPFGFAKALPSESKLGTNLKQCFKSLAKPLNC